MVRNGGVEGGDVLSDLRLILKPLVPAKTVLLATATVSMGQQRMAKKPDATAKGAEELL